MAIIPEDVFLRVGPNLEPIALGGISPGEAKRLEDKVNAAQTSADDALPQAGGYMTGSIRYTISSTDISESPAANRFTMPIIAEDKNKVGLGALQFNHFTDGTLQADIHVSRTIGDAAGRSYSRLGINIAEDGTTYGTVPHPRDNSYGNDIVTSKWAQDNFSRNFPIGQSAIYVGGSNASDTAALFAGRGRSPEMPFATFAAAWDWMRIYHYNNGLVIIYLQSDIEWGTTSYPTFSAATLNHVVIASYPESTVRKLTLPHALNVNSGSLSLKNLKLDFPRNGSGCALKTDGCAQGGAPTLQVHNCELTGNVEVVAQAVNNGTMLFANCTGSISGKKYDCTRGSRIIGESTIPGTLAGTKDASSVVI